MKATKAPPGFDSVESCKVTLGGMHIIFNVRLKSSVSLGSVHRLELVPIKGVWFSNHLVSVRLESKPWEKIWALRSQLKVGSTEIREVNRCKKGDAERDWGRGRKDTQMHVDGHTLSQPRFLPLFTAVSCVTSPALPSLPRTGLSGSCTTLSLQNCLGSLFSKMPFSQSSHHHTYRLYLSANLCDNTSKKNA